MSLSDIQYHNLQLIWRIGYYYYIIHFYLTLYYDLTHSILRKPNNDGHMKNMNSRS